MCGVASWVSWVWCHRGMVPSQIFRGSTTFSRWYLIDPKLFLVGILWDQNIFSSVLFQIDFNNCKLCLYWIGTLSAKLPMLLRSFSFCYNLGQNISDKLQFFCEIAPYRKSSISIFQYFFVSIEKMLILGARLGTRLQFYEVLRSS